MKKVFSLALLLAVMASCKKNKQDVIIYEVNSARSVAGWKGATPNHFHTGTFTVQGGINTRADGSIKGGSFIIPIASIQNDDLPNPVRQELLNHLKSPDFFNMIAHPNADFTITKAVPYTTADTAAITGANYLLTGNFSMIGQTHSITFPAKINMAGDSVNAEAKFKLDRTQWGMNSFSDPTKELYILPNVDMHLTIRAGRKQR